MDKKMRLEPKFTTRELALLALFSAVWAAIEINLGFILKIFKVPFSGTLLTFIGLIILFLGRTSVPRRGTAIFMGITTSFLKLVYLGGLAIYPIIGIMIEVILVEIGLSRKHPVKPQFLLAGVLALLWSFFHPFFTQGVLAGWGIVKVYVIIIERGSRFLGVEQQYAIIIFMSLILFHIVLGIIAGSIGLRLSQIVLNSYAGVFSNAGKLKKTF